MIITKINYEDIQENNKNYNTQNHWIDNIKPIDYIKKQEEIYTNKWINKFPFKYITIEFDESDINKLKEMNNFYILQNRLSDIHETYIDIITTKYNKKNNIDEILKSGKFIRTESVSLKYGIHKCGPYYNIKQIIESIVSCPLDHTPLHDLTYNSKKLTLYIIDWVIINKYKEFRMFVYNNQITAISQQHLYNKNEYLSKFTKDEQNKIINKWIFIIQAYFNSYMIHNITHIDNYVCDIALINDIPYFIELNPFGKEYSSGSALFHWIHHEDILYGNYTKIPKAIYFRYTY
jgi:hypothetical protein